MESFKHFLKTELNKPQQQAVKQKTGAMVVIAGAGSGKTRVITARMAHLIMNEGIDPSSIIALTFTNKAAGEMKERLLRFIGTRYSLPFVGTFHSYCLLLLRRNQGLIPFNDFSILDEDDKRAMLKRILKSSYMEKQVKPTQLSYQISNVKNKPHTLDEAMNNLTFREAYLAYESEKSTAHCLDFDDLILTVLHAFNTNKQFKETFQKRIKHILVDEYQDTNTVQHDLLKHMALDESDTFVAHSVCAVGDEDQSIYSWRGAVATNMLSFQKDFAPVITIKIEQNYRSVQPILKAANALIDNNPKRNPKELWSEKKAKNRILQLTCKSGYQESDLIAEYIKTLPKKTTLSSLAILYRTHFQSRLIEESLIRNSIPYKIIGGIRFYERREIKDMLAYLRLIANPFDRASFFRVINVPGRGLGPKAELAIYDEWHKNPLLDFKQLLQFMLETSEHGITGTKAQSLRDFLDVFEGLSKDKHPGEALEQILEKTTYLGYLRRTLEPQEANSKIENLREFSDSIIRFESSNSEPTLETFLHEVALLQEKLDKDNEQNDYIQMMTLHAAKGLEFDTVMIVGLEENLLPSSRSLYSDDDLEEERRLLYVGMTRSRERLVLSHALSRNTYGQISDQVISRFLTEVPNRLLTNIDASKLYPSQIASEFSSWLGQTPAPKREILTFGSAPSKTIKPARKAGSFLRSPGAWKKNQPVIHKKFGAGIVRKIEKASDKNYYLTVLFKVGEKKLLSTFVKAV